MAFWKYPDSSHALPTAAYMGNTRKKKKGTGCNSTTDLRKGEKGYSLQHVGAAWVPRSCDWYSRYFACSAFLSSAPTHPQQLCPRLYTAADEAGPPSPTACSARRLPCLSWVPLQLLLKHERDLFLGQPGAQPATWLREVFEEAWGQLRGRECLDETRQPAGEG